MSYPKPHLIVQVSALCTLVACSQGTPPSANGGTSANSPVATSGSSSGSDWTANGATACEKYLTPDVVTAILSIPAERPQQLDPHSCQAGPIYIALKVADIDVFRQELPMIAGTHALAGVGDDAYWNGAGAVSAVKGHDRGCDINAPYGTKIHDAALGQKLGEICNKLFALP